MSEIEQRIRAGASAAVMKRNPHIFKSRMPVVAARADDTRPRITTDEGRLNKLERDWLAALRDMGYPEIHIQCVTLKLADDTRYTPDFVTRSEVGIVTAWECKGFMRDDANVKVKVAARQYRGMMRFVVVVRRKGGGFDQTEVRP